MKWLSLSSSKHRLFVRQINDTLTLCAWISPDKYLVGETVPKNPIGMAKLRALYSAYRSNPITRIRVGYTEHEEFYPVTSPAGCGEHAWNNRYAAILSNTNPSTQLSLI